MSTQAVNSSVLSVYNYIHSLHLCYDNNCLCVRWCQHCLPTETGHPLRPNTVVREIFVCRKFRVKNFRAEIFSWSGPTTKIFQQRKFIHVRLRKWRIMKGLCVFAAFTCIATSGRRLAIGEVLDCERELGNAKDRYTVAVKKDATVIGHLPRKISRVSSLFLRQGGSVQCTVTGRRRYSFDLPQGGLEIPCLVKFTAQSKEIQKLKQLLKS